MSDEVDFVAYSPTALAEAAGRAFSVYRAVELVEEGTTVENVLVIAEAIFKFIMPDGWDKDKPKARQRLQVVKNDT